MRYRYMHRAALREVAYHLAVVDPYSCIPDALLGPFGPVVGDVARDATALARTTADPALADAWRAVAEAAERRTATVGEVRSALAEVAAVVG